MKLHNTLTRKTEEFKPLHKGTVRMYSCGPTVYDHAHIGNLSSFIYADTLRRVLKATGYEVEHVMNFTDVDDKTIRRSAERFPDMSREEALKKLTSEYKQLFLDDMAAIGNDTVSIKFVSATETIEGMRALIRDLYDEGFAYIADDGVYFSIEKYRASGKKYGQLTEISEQSTSNARIQNDEYDKENVHDFALWKTRKDDEPAWFFELYGQDLTGRPGWHIECSVMSVNSLGMPFDIHTGGVDLIFPHHENEIAQSTAGKGNVYAKYFYHSEHMLVDGKKMSKSLNNFYTLQDIRERGFEPLAFRLLVLQSHYRSQTNFSWDNLEAAQNRLQHWREVADLTWQTENSGESDAKAVGDIVKTLQDDLNTPEAIANIESAITSIENSDIENVGSTVRYLVKIIEKTLGLDLTGSDITNEQKQTLKNRQKARDEKDFKKSDELRDQLKEQGIGVRDTKHGQIWFRI